MSVRFRRGAPQPCTKVVAAVFGTLFLIALLSVPVTTRTSQDRRDPASSIVIRTTYPRNTTMFLPSYLSAKAHTAETGDVRLRPAQWVGTLAIIAVLGVFDYFVFCRLLRRKRRIPEEP